MTDSLIEKNAVSAQVIPSLNNEVSELDLQLINNYTRRQLSKNEVFVFSVVLCDNDIDRDGERFTVESLFELQKLFIGKTGIIDHNPSAYNQTARIFSCEVESVDGMKNFLGDDYFRLTAKAYLPVSDKNKDVILAIDSGIIKEVSVGCAVGNIVCNICGKDIATCSHNKGETYNGKVCCGELINPYDAYEWSFVAVPSQKRAGVTKAFIGKDFSMIDILNKIDERKGFALSDNDCVKLCDYINNLKQSASDGVFYRDSLIGEVLRLSAIAQPEISRATMESVLKNMNVVQLNEFKSAFEKQKNASFSAVPQLYSAKEFSDNFNSESDTQFKF